MGNLVIFDLDGTLIDSVPDLSLAVDQTLEALSLPKAGEAQVRQWVGNGAAKLVERALHFVGASETGLHGQALEYFYRFYQDCCAQRTSLYPQVPQVLSELQQRACTMAVVTNKPRKFVAPILRKLSIDTYFAAVWGGDDFPHKKPHPQPLLHCMETLGFSPEQTIMVGDSRNDIQAARNADIFVAAVDYGYNHGKPVEDEHPDVVLSSIYQVLDHLKIP